jgi:hypothetical protein
VVFTSSLSLDCFLVFLFLAVVFVHVPRCESVLLCFIHNGLPHIKI